MRPYKAGPKRPRDRFPLPEVQLFDADQTARYLGVSAATVYKLTAAGTVVAVRWGAKGTSLRWRKSDLDRFLAALPVAEEPVRPAVGRGSEPEAAAS